MWVLTAATAHLGALGRVVDLGGKIVVETLTRPARHLATPTDYRSGVAPPGFGAPYSRSSSFLGATGSCGYFAVSGLKMCVFHSTIILYLLGKTAINLSFELFLTSFELFLSADAPHGVAIPLG